MIKPEKFLTIDEQKAVMAYIGLRWSGGQHKDARYRWHLIALLMLDAGLRLSECLHLKQFDIASGNRPKDLITIRAEISKTKEPRIIPVTTRLKIAISFIMATTQWKQQQQYNQFVFPSGCIDKPISSRAVQAMFKIIGDHSIGRRLTPHMLRHTFATRMMKAAPISVVQNLLGHSSLSSTQIYMHPTIQDSIDGIGKLSM